jgi:hypothetical protein
LGFQLCFSIVRCFREVENGVVGEVVVWKGAEEDRYWDGGGGGEKFGWVVVGVVVLT